MVETRTDTIVAREPGYRVEAWRPERDSFGVSVRLDGDRLVANVARTRACMLAQGERRTISTQVDRSAATFDLVLEGLSGVWLIAAGARITNDGVPKVGMVPIAIGAALTTGFFTDLTGGSEHTEERSEIVKTGMRESLGCQQGPGSGAVVEFAMARGVTLSCVAGADGTCSVGVPSEAWQAPGGTLGVDVSVNGRRLRHEELTKKTR